MNRFRSSNWARSGPLWFATAVIVLAANLIPAAWAYTNPPNTLQFTLEGCRIGGNIPITPTNTLPNADGNFVCQDPAPLGGNDTPYVSGNLGKGWNELDLVPHRLIAKNGNSTGSVTYNVIIAADNKTAGKVGYDLVTPPEILRAPELNAFSDSSCQMSYDVQSITGSVTGGADEVIYRVLTITQNKNTTCVIDWANRLAIGSHLYPGSSLQSYMFEREDFSTGKRTISIPVREILPQELRKDMSATQDTDFAWNISKEPTPATVTFGDTCDIDQPKSQAVSVRVEWEILPGVAGKVMVVTNIYAKNPASRSVTVNVSDTICSGLPCTAPGLDTASSGDVVVPANTELKVFEHTYQAEATVTDLNDVATASYFDTAYPDIPIPGNTTAVASALIQPGTQTNTTAIVTDTESISGIGLQYSADSTTFGSANGTFTLDNGTPNGLPYVLTTKLDKDSFPLLWTSVTQNGSLTCTNPDGCPVGFVEFNKTVYVDPVPAITSGTLSDTATLTASDGFTASSGPATINISTDAKVKLTLKKTIPDILQDSETITCNFEVKNSGGVVVASPSFEFTAGETQEQTTITGLAPDTYTVTEGSCGGLVPSGGTTQSVDLKLPTCADMVTFTNIVGAGSAVAEVKKVTEPAGFEKDWQFTLNGPGTNGGILVTYDGTGFDRFVDGDGNTFQLLEGPYTITETPQVGWQTPPAASGCEFTVNYPADFGKVFQCVYTNKKLGKVIINKETDPDGDTTTDFTFTQNVDTSGNFMLKDGGSKSFLDVAAGTYTVTESDPKPGYDLVNLVCTDGQYNVVNSSTDLVTRKATINVDPGETVECTFTNRKRGMVELLKLTNGVQDPSMKWTFTLTGKEVNVSDSTPPPLMDFNGAKLIPGETYTLCETGIPAGWSLLWVLDNDPIYTLGVPPDVILPFVGGKASVTSLLQVYDPDPNYGMPNAVNDTRCVDFKVEAGQTVNFIVDNQRPGGEPRTPGYWKNWNTCTGGNQWMTAQANGGTVAGWYILDDVLPVMLGNLSVTTCQNGVYLLNKSSLDGKKRANDGAYEVAAMLLAAKANLTAGAETCTAVTGAIAQADALLITIGFNGLGPYLPPKPTAPRTLAERTEALSIAKTLDYYNNGMLCQ